jgi:hypothetical protein
MTEARPTKMVACCANHDHSLGMNAVDFETGSSLPCIHSAKEAIIELTDEEIAQREADSVAFAEQKAAQEAAAEALATLKASARAKLVAGQPLTEEEAATLVI